MASTPNLKTQYTNRLNETNQKISGLYDDQYNAKAASLKTAYDQSTSDLAAQREQIVPTYQAQSNALARNYEQNRRNSNLSATMNGLNTGTQVQQQNALSNNYMQNYAGLQGQRAGALTENDQKAADLLNQYNANLTSAKTSAETSKASALMENYTTQQNWLETQAANLANYGDFSGYEQLYGKAQAKQMKNAWIAQNPDAAYRTGQITRATYKKMTGKDPT